MKHRWTLLLLAIFRYAYSDSSVAKTYHPAADSSLPDRQFKLNLLLPETLKPKAEDSYDYYEVGVRWAEKTVMYDPSKKLPKTQLFLYGDANEDMGTTTTYSFPGPCLQAQVGRPTRVKWTNQLKYPNGEFRAHLIYIPQTIPWANPKDRDTRGHDPGCYTGAVPTVTQVHGVITTDDSDGYPQCWYLPDAKNIPDGHYTVGTLYEHMRNKGVPGWTPGSAVFQYPNKQHPGSFLYHDNTFGISSRNRAVGMFGRYNLDGPTTGPDLDGVTTIDLTLSDITLDENAQIVYPHNQYQDCDDDTQTADYADSPPDVFGNINLVNGRAWPVLVVHEQCYRFRIINAANSRWYKLRFEFDLEFTIIGVGAGYLDGKEFPHGRTTKSAWIHPGGGYLDIVVDFKGLQLNKVTLFNDGPDGPLKDEDHFDCADPATTGKVMQFDVQPFTEGTGKKQLRCPSITLKAVNLLDATSIQKQVAFVVTPRHDACPPGTHGHALHQCAHYKDSTDPTPRFFNDPITESSIENKVQVWRVRNKGKEYETLRFHGSAMEVVGLEDEDGGKLDCPPWRLGLLTVAVIPPGTTLVVKVLYLTPGLFTWSSLLVERRDYDKKAPLCVGVNELGCRFANREVVTVARENLCLVKTRLADGDRCVTKSPIGNDAILDFCRGTDNQLWLRPDLFSDAFLFENVALVNGQRACLAIYNGIAEGQTKKNVVVWDCNDHDPFQTWRREATLLGKGFILSNAPVSSRVALDWETGQNQNGVYLDVIVRRASVASPVWELECGPTCRYQEWGEWSACSVQCGKGERTRERQAELPGLSYCDDGTTESEPCNTWECVVQEQCMIRPRYDPYHMKCLSLSSNNNIEVAPCTGEDSQRWTYNGKVLKSMGLVSGLEVCCTVAPDLSIRAWPCDKESESQQWSQYFDALVNVQEGLCLDVTDGIDWTIQNQPVGIKSCHGRENQAWVFDCTAADLCVNYCPGVCACKLDNALHPFCVCPGPTCSSLQCFNGGKQYYDGNDCRCQCPIGFTGAVCDAPLACTYTPWTDWTPCTTQCGGGQHTRTRLPLQYPELCLDITDIKACNVAPCGSGPVVVVPPGPGPIVPPVSTVPDYIPIPFIGTQTLAPTGTKQCRVQLTQGTTQACMQVKNGLQVTAESCSQSPDQQWSYDGKTLRNGGKCLDISGGPAGTDMVAWSCHGGDNQQFSVAANKIIGTSGNCVQKDAATNSLKSKACATATGQWSVACANASSTGSPSNVTDTAGCSFTVGTTSRCVATDGSKMMMAACDGSGAQQWTISLQDRTMRSPAFPGKCVDIEGGVRGNRAILWDCNGQANQQFVFDGTHITASDGRCLDVEGGVNGQNILLWACGTGANQQFAKNCGNVTTTPPVPSACGEWGSWGACSVSCGYGVQARVTAHFENCPDPVQVRTCEQGPCLPHDCSYSAWSAWSSCSNSCGGGFATRFRQSQGGAVSETGPCTSTAEIKLCNLLDCPP